MSANPGTRNQTVARSAASKAAGKKQMNPSQVDLVLEGGGAKGIGHLGVIEELEERGCQWNRIAGVSAGAIVGALLARDFTAADIRKELVHLSEVKDERKVAGFRGRGPVVPAANVLLHGSLYRGEWVRKWLRELLQIEGPTDADPLARRPLTFGDLRMSDPDRPDDDPLYKLVVLATDLTLGRLVYLPWDYQELYGVNPDEQVVADAVYASMALPFAFPAVQLLDGGDGCPLASHHGIGEFVDGGLLANFPIEIFDRRDLKSPRWPTIGVKILPRLPWTSTDLTPNLYLPALQFAQRVLVTAIFGRDETRLDLPWIKARTIEVDTSSVGVLGFESPAAEIDKVVKGGRTVAGAFVEGWDWANYRKTYRGGTTAK